MEGGNGEGGLICIIPPSCVLSALLVSLSVLPSAQVQSREGVEGSWCSAPTSRVPRPPSGWVDTSRLSGSDSRSPNVAPACVGSTRPAASCNNLSPNTSPTGSAASKAPSCCPLVDRGGCCGHTQSINLALPTSSRETLGGGRIFAKGGHDSHGSSA